MSLEASKIARPFFRSEASFENESLEVLVDFIEASEGVDAFLDPKQIFSLIGGLDNGVFGSGFPFLFGVIDTSISLSLANECFLFFELFWLGVLGLLSRMEAF